MRTFSLLLSLCSLFLLSPIFAQELPTPTPGKALVIFTRPPLEAPVIQFQYFDGEQFLGKIGPGSYLTYECDPGKHLLWGKSENRDYLEANLEADRIYIVNTEVRTGAIQARIILAPFDPNGKNAEKEKERLIKRISKKKEKRFDPAAIKKSDHWMKATINQGMADYERMKKKEKKIDVLTADMHI